MKLSLNWLKEYIDLDIEPVKLGEILTEIGLEVDSLEKVETVKGGLKGIVIGHVLECDKHPNADRLTLNKVDVGNGEPLQIICGAPNVATGQKVLVATEGTLLYDKEGNSFKIKRTKMRGEWSEGMICAEDELGLGEDHSGIMVLPETATIGTAASEYFNVQQDWVYGIELTPNRSDATSHLGIARDLAAALKINFNHSGDVNWPDVSTFAEGDSDDIEVVVENDEACPRYSGLIIKGIKIDHSPEWMQHSLRSIGVRPINNIVDITNFILHELGQPLHAFDLDKIGKRKIVVKTLSEGTPFTTLDEVDRKLSVQDLMICDGDHKGMCIGGVFGGIGTGISEETKDIFLESAYFNPVWIRRSSTRHQLRTDAAVCFEKGSDPNQTVFALKRAALLIKEFASGEIASRVVDIYQTPIKPCEVQISFKNINRLIGTSIPSNEVFDILEALQMEVTGIHKDGFTVAVPTNKADVNREADVIEEILRIYGYNKVPVPGKIKSAVNISEKPDQFRVRHKIGSYLSANGFMEIMALSMTQEHFFKDILNVPENELVQINNTSNVTLNTMRHSMLPGGMEALLHNQNRQQHNAKLFEYGRTYKTDGSSTFEETEHLTLFLSGQRYPESWLNNEKKVADFFTVKAYVNHILSQLGIQNFKVCETQVDLFEYGLNYSHKKDSLVDFGELKSRIVDSFDLKGKVYYADFYWDRLMDCLKAQQLYVTDLDRYPSTRRDLALVVDNQINFHDIAYIARDTAKNILREINLFDVYRNTEQLGKGKKSYAVSFIFQASDRTLQDKEIDDLMEIMIKACEDKLQANIRR